MKENNYSLFIFCLLVVCFSKLPFGFCEKNNINKCGVITALTGHLSSSGKAIKNAIILLKDQRKDAQDIEFIFEDDQFIPSKTVSAAKRLIDVEKVQCLIVFGSPTSLAVADLAERNKIPLLSIAISNKIIKDRKYSFLVFISSENQNKKIQEYISTKKYKSAAIISTISDGTLELKDLFIESTNTKVLFNQEVNPEDIDFRSIASKITKLKPDSVFINMLPPQISIFAKQLRSFGYNGEFFSGPPVGNPAEILASDGALDGSWFVSVDSRNADEYYSDYYEKFNEKSAVQGLYGYEAANLVINGFKTGNFINYLNTTKKVNGLLGNFEINNNLVNLPAAIWSINDSQMNILAN
jgi:ABC-type branched-subunit amino acid transport system substrate-binding protein